MSSVPEKITMIWANLVDCHNKEIFTKEQKLLKTYIPSIPEKKNAAAEQATAEALATDVCSEAANAEKKKEIIDICSENYKTLDLFELIKRQSVVASLLAKHFLSTFQMQNPEKFQTYTDEMPQNISLYVNGLKWLNNTSLYICKYTNTTDLIKPIQTDRVQRSSYKFCTKKSECGEQYGLLLNVRPKHTCTQDHFVHYKIIRDIKCLMDVYNKQGNRNIHFLHDMKTSLITMSFVINHMVQELEDFIICHGQRSNFSIENYYIIHRK